MKNDFESLLKLEDLQITSEILLEQSAAGTITAASASVKSEVLSDLEFQTDESSTNLRAEVASVHIPEADQSKPPEPPPQNPDKYQTAKPTTIGPGHAVEPFSQFSETDRVGLAFSGGGIRSATFNLGLLKSLNELDALRFVDYVASVSGGGYIASWWTAWRSKNNRHPDVHFPKAGTTHGRPDPEPVEVLHLRKFSNFLVPRIGFFEVEFWNGVLAVLCSLLPSLLIANSFLLATIWAWLITSWMLIGLPTFWSGVVLVLITSVVLFGVEWWWHDTKEDSPPWLDTNFWIASVIALAVLVAICLAVSIWLPHSSAPNAQQQASSSPDSFPASFGDSSVARQLFCPAAIWLGTAVILIAFRTLSYGVLQLYRGLNQGSQRTYDFELAVRRVLDRIVALAIASAAAGAIWLFALRFQTLLTTFVSTGSIGAVLFAMLRKWFPVAMRPAKQVGFAKSLLPLIPQLLAYLVIVLALVANCILIQFSFPWTTATWAVPIAAGAVVVLGWYLFDPVNVGIHAFYRDRICRAYLGASNNDQDARQQTEPQPHDDLPLSQTHRRPFHLICCAANELDYDPLANFARGARSAVLSRIGLSIGDSWTPCPDLMVSSAVTASAAAFNPAMGSVSMQLGPAVAFLMCALGLRLGLWIDRPDKPADSKPHRRKSGLFFRELLSRSDKRLIHLSDGAHFENLALYELVRRHCRYIIVSDCGADPTVAFDDLANATRRIREDFGVEIEIDVAPLKPGADGLAREHMVVGTIHYDRLDSNRNDKGILLYFKPNLTGDEPSDVQQYATRNSAFPNESTVDQFYDEAQWESYRRLGEHAARSALRFIERSDPPPNSSSQLFSQARKEWYPTPLDLESHFVELTARFTALEEKLRVAPPAFATEIYPELGALTNQPAAAMTPTEMQSVLSLLVQMMQLMEDVYVGCRLEETSDHPLNAGWMNLFARWSGSETFRLWWTFLKALYSFRFRTFAERQFSLAQQIRPRISDPDEQQIPTGLAETWWRRANPDFRWESGHFACDYRFVYEAANPGLPPVSWQIALLVAKNTHDTNGKRCATWNDGNFYVPPSLWGTGIGGSFLRSLCELLQQNGYVNCEVEITKGRDHTDAASRAARTDTIAFYKAAGFRETEQGNLVRDLSGNV